MHLTNVFSRIFCRAAMFFGFTLTFSTHGTGRIYPSDAWYGLLYYWYIL